MGRDLTLEEIDRLELEHAIPNGRAAPTADVAEELDLSGRLRPGGGWILDASPVPEPVWGLDDEVLWSKGESLILTGPQGVGKTTLTGQLLAGRLGILDELLGFPVAPDTSGRVLYLAADRPAQIQRSLRRNFDEEHREILDEHLVVWPGPPPGDVAKKPSLLLELARRAGATTLFVDSMKDLAVGIASDDIGAAVNLALQTCTAHGIEVCVLHHQRKSSGEQKKPRTLADVYGSVWLTAGAGSVLLLWGEAGDPIVDLEHLKQPASQVGPLKIEHDHVRARTTVFRGFDPLIAIRHSPHGLTANDVARLWFEKQPTDNDRRKAQRRLDALVEKRLLHRAEPQRGGEGGTKPARYHAIENRLEEP